MKISERIISRGLDNPAHRGLRGCTQGKNGPVKYIVKNGNPVEQNLDDIVAQLTREQEQSEQDYTAGCPF